MGTATSWTRHPSSNPMEPALTCDNRSAATRWWNTEWPLTHSLDCTEEGLAMQPTRKRGIDPVPTAPTTGLTAELKAIFDGWPERFRRKVRLSAGCWEWTACKDKHGYGRYGTTRERGTQPAHRMALELTNGEPVPPGVVVDHLCRNTSCVRPDHLDPTSQAENIRRGATSATAAGWCRAGMHEWTAGNILTEADGAKRCRPCRQAYERARSVRRRGVA